MAPMIASGIAATISTAARNGDSGRPVSTGAPGRQGAAFGRKTGVAIGRANGIPGVIHTIGGLAVIC